MFYLIGLIAKIAIFIYICLNAPGYFFHGPDQFLLLILVGPFLFFFLFLTDLQRLPRPAPLSEEERQARRANEAERIRRERYEDDEFDFRKRHYYNKY